ncbi:MAG TPA: hypothetical protein VGS08_01590 [Candidatus Saccharimonadales bacterium]|nr:hypothetical protein [Candidatus Saccharimonadales bacterium]
MKKIIMLLLALLITGGVVLWNTWVFVWLNHGTAGLYSNVNQRAQCSWTVFRNLLHDYRGSEWIMPIDAGLGPIGVIRKGFFMLFTMRYIDQTVTPTTTLSVPST